MINLSPEIKSIQSLYREFIENKLIVNRKYQRKLVWTIEEKEKLIESILNSFPIPNILLAKINDNSELEIIDGMQRLYTIMSFIEQKFTYKGKYFNLENFPTAKLRGEKGLFHIQKHDNIEYLSDEECVSILDYSISTLIVRNASHEIINDIFSRINTYGHRLSNQERRQAGIQSSFSDLVRKISANMRGDNSTEILPLGKMPEISIDLPRNKVGYSILAEDTFWVKQGILRSTDLRESEDEQCIADIIASIVYGQPLARSKDALDALYQLNSAASKNINDCLSIYGTDKIEDEFNFCVNYINSLCSEEKLKNMISDTSSNNSIPSIFSQFFIAMHEIIFMEKKSISDIGELRNRLKSLKTKNISDGRTSENRKNNINMIKGLIRDAFQEKLDINKVYKGIDEINVDSFISCIVEQPTLEFKQGCLSLNSNDRVINDNIFDKIICTMCAIANTAEDGVIIIGVADKPEDVSKIIEIDNIVPRQVYKRKVVGINREAEALGISLDEYLKIWRDKVQKSKLSEPLKQNVLSNFKYIPYHGLGLIVVKISKQKEYSTVGDKIYWRKMDNTTLITEEASSHQQIVELSRRFQP